jgi:hypothetical protein
MNIPMRKTTESTRESWERTDFELSSTSIPDKPSNKGVSGQFSGCPEE